MKINIKKGRETIQSYHSNIDNGYQQRTQDSNSEIKVRVLNPRNKVDNRIKFKNKYEKKNTTLNTSMINHFDDKEKDSVKKPFNTKSKFLSEDDLTGEKTDREIYEEMKKKENEKKVEESIRKSIEENVNKSKDETSAVMEDDSILDKLNKYDEEYGDLEGGLQPMKKKRNIKDMY